MEKTNSCKKCGKIFKVSSGVLSRAKEIQHIVVCPFCAETNEVMWPTDTGFTTIPRAQSTK